MEDQRSSVRMFLQKMDNALKTTQSHEDLYENPDTFVGNSDTLSNPRLKDILTKQCSVINHAAPTRYLLHSRKKNVDGKDTVRRWTVGIHDPTKRHKTLLLLGQLGSGKTTLTNLMVNYAMGVKWEDNVRFQVTDDYKDTEKLWKHDTKTKYVTAYEVFGYEETELPFSLTIIDTPGIEDRSKLRPLMEQLRRLLEDEKVDQIDAVCHVVKASQNRLSEHQRNIFDGFVSLLGKDMKDNILTLVTHSDGTVPQVLDILVESKIQGDTEPVHYTFNNHLFHNKDLTYDSIYEKSWRSGVKTMREFFDQLNGMQQKRSKQTIVVLKERLRLEDCSRQERIESEVAATCCPVCEENCHVGCMACRPYFCEIMLRGKCTVCRNRCGHKQHVRGRCRYADGHKTLKVQIQECVQNLRENALKPDLAPILKVQMDEAREKGDKEKLLELVEKEKIISEIISDGRRYDTP